MSDGTPKRRLVIVESPAKAKTIKGYLGPGYEVEASVGHIRDLPNKAADVPAKYKGQPWAKLAVDVDHDFKALYVVNPDKKSKVTELKKLLAEADELLLATDEDREGEAIAWHLMEVLKPKCAVRRMVFNEITKDAIRRAAEDTRELDQDLVDAQETRRILDRLYGYEVSPVLWKKVMPRLSAGRVQSVALRIIVERERERIAFTSAGYWSLAASLSTKAKARLVSVDGSKVAGSGDFDDSGALKKSDLRVLDEATATALAAALEGQTGTVSSVDAKPSTRRPSAPFMTSTLQQEASRKFKWGAQRTMRVAQGLYERGFITYMRTDSTTLSKSALDAARDQARELYGADHVPASPRLYERKVKNAQEAHEAIRPSGDVFRTPGELSGTLTGDEFALYDLIWKRTVASQMADAKVSTTTIKIDATSTAGEQVVLQASGTVVLFKGFMAAYEEGTDEEPGDGEGTSEREAKLPKVDKGDTLPLQDVIADGHSTKPPARYTEASLVKKLEELSIGRPSTYASIMSTLVDRGYVVKRGSALTPTWLAFAVTRLLEEHFGQLVDFRFTAGMEEILDQISAGEEQRTKVLTDFYFGDEPGLKPLVDDLGDIDARQISSFPISGTDLTLRVGKYGPYLEGPEPEDGTERARANVPSDLPPDELTAAKAIELMNQPSGERALGTDPMTGNEVVAKTGRFGPYITEVLPEPAEGEKPKRGAAKVKPRTASLFKDMSLDTVTLEDALKLLSLPREVGIHPESGEPIVAKNGPYGPYVSHGRDSRTLPDEPSLFTVTLEEALALLAQPKARRGRTAATGRVIGVDPTTQKEITVKEGRFGPYVTDGETNASLRRTDDPDQISLERAADLIAERRAAGPPVKKAAKRTPARRTKASTR